MTTLAPAAPQIVPVQPISSQTLSVTLGNQACTIAIYTKHIWVPRHLPDEIVTDSPVYEAIDPIFLDLDVNNVQIIAGVLCLNTTLIVRDTYLGFVGDLSFEDTQGSDDPQVSGLGTRWLLTYWPSLS